jgi:ankyrin repeat protein
MAFTDDTDLFELIDAAVEDHDKALQLLKRLPDLIARRNRLDETALHFLVVENYPKGVEFLCCHGADVNTMDFSESTPLLHASTLGYGEVVRILLAHGANPNMANHIDDTPLSCAERSGNQQIVEMLIKAGAKAEPKAPPDTDSAGVP